MNDIVLPSRHSNITSRGFDFSTMRQFSNISSVSSRRSRVNEDLNENDDVIIVSSEEMARFYLKVDELERENENGLTDDYPDASISLFASTIESRINAQERHYCVSCKNVFQQNEKVAIITTKTSNPPCKSTFDICKRADKFLRMEILKNNVNFNIILQATFEGIDFENVFVETDFSHEIQHKVFLIQDIVKQYVHIKSTWLAKKTTMDIHAEKVRRNYLKLIHVRGQ